MEKKLRKFKALVTEMGLDDIGASGLVYETAQLVRGEIYTQADLSEYGRRGTADFFVDSNGCARDIDYMLASKKVEEVFE